MPRNNFLYSTLLHQEFCKPTMSTVDRIIKREKKMLGLLSGNGIDPACVRQANAEARDNMFFKLDNYIKVLYVIEKFFGKHTPTYKTPTFIVLMK